LRQAVALCRRRTAVAIFILNKKESSLSLRSRVMVHCDLGQLFFVIGANDLFSFSHKGNIFPTGKVLESSAQNSLEAIFWIKAMRFASIVLIHWLAAFLSTARFQMDFDEEFFSIQFLRK